jgi:hypothetical protein
LADDRKNPHFGLAASHLSLAEIETRLRDEGWGQAVIDETLAFVIDVRQKLTEIGTFPRRDPRPH